VRFGVLEASERQIEAQNGSVAHKRKIEASWHGKQRMSFEARVSIRPGKENRNSEKLLGLCSVSVTSNGRLADLEETT